MTRSITLVAVTLGLVVGCRDERPREQPLARLAKTCLHDAEISCPRPVFTVKDLRASQRYYARALGFHLDWDHGDPPTFGSVTRGDANLFLCEGCDAPRGAWAMVFAKSVDKLHDELAAHGAIIKMPPTDMPWGLRELHVADPDGNVLRFGSGIDHD